MLRNWLPPFVRLYALLLCFLAPTRLFADPAGDLTVIADPKDELLFNARTKVHHGNYQTGFDLIESAIKQYPDYPDCYASRGWAYGYIGQFQLAIADYDKAISMSPKSGSYYSSRGELNFESAKYKEAVADFSTAIQINPSLATNYKDRAAAYRDLHQIESAIADLNTVAKIWPTDSQVFLQRAELFAIDKSTADRALIDCANAIALNPKDPKPLLLSASIKLDAKHDTKAAMQDLERAVAIDPSYAAAYTKMGAVRLAENQPALAALDIGRGKFYAGELPDAVQQYDRALALQPGLVAAKYEKARAQFHLVYAEPKPLLDDSSEPMELTPAYQVWQKQNNALISNAFDSFVTAEKAAPNDVKTILAFGRVQMVCHHEHDAYLHFQQAIKLNPNSADAYFCRGICEHFYGPEPAGISPELHLQPADEQTIKGNTLAKADLDRALDLSGPDSNTYFMRAECERALKNYPAALHDYDLAIRNHFSTNQLDDLSQLFSYQSQFLNFTPFIVMRHSPYGAAVTARGLCEWEMGHHGDAANWISVAIECAPTEASLFYLRGWMTKTDDPQNAAQDFNRAMSLDRGNSVYKSVAREQAAAISAQGNPGHGEALHDNTGRGGALGVLIMGGVAIELLFGNTDQSAKPSSDQATNSNQSSKPAADFSRTCPACNGSGSGSGPGYSPCPLCNGSGQVHF